MFQRDYFMRLIEQLTEGIGAALGLRQQKKFEQAYDALDDLLHRLSLPKRGVLKALAVPDLVSLVTGPGAAASDKLYGAAKVLFEDGNVAAAEGDAAAADASRRKAIRLYTEAVRLAREHRSDPPDPAELEAMLSRVDRNGLAAEDHAALAVAYEAYGRYAAAEDRWFDALELDPEGATAYEAGLRFYERLMLLDGETLAAGGLPLDEVREGYAEFKRRFGRRTFG